MIISAVRAFVLCTLAPARGLGAVGDDESLVDSGIVDSLGVFQLVAFLEETFGLRIADEDITPENFGSIVAIVRFVEERKNGRSMSDSLAEPSRGAS
jgi:acyl carrier protein